MPARNSRKLYVEDGYYHIYNRGVEKRKIFIDEQDYSVFLNYLKEYLLAKDTNTLVAKLSDPTATRQEKSNVHKLLRMNNFFGEITMIAYCLMPNHFHFLIKQHHAGSIDSFMNSLATRYTMYFNRKYSRVGSLYQGVYKAVNIKTDEQLLHLSRYIHSQADVQGEALHTIHPSSYLNYIGKKHAEWIHPEDILSHFSRYKINLSYEQFMRDDVNFSSISDVLLDE